MTEDSFLAGKLLVAVSGLRDPNFHRTVVFIAEHDEQGAFGLVLNRESGLRVGEALPLLAEEPLGAVPVHYGGPVQPEVLFFLHDDETIRGQGVLPGLRLGGDEQGLRQLQTAWACRPRPRCRIFSGYSGWGGGQLEFEMSQGAWGAAEASADLVRGDEATLWKRVLEGLGGRWAIMGQTPPDPDLN